MDKKNLRKKKKKRKLYIKIILIKKIRNKKINTIRRAPDVAFVHWWRKV